jgi:hypothetical protein
MRCVVRIPLLVNAVDSTEETEWEPVETIVVSLHGGLIRTRQKFPVGTTLDIRLRDVPRSTQGRVVWMATGGNGGVFELGFEILGQPGFWEIKFPPDRWPEPTRTRSSGR